MKSAKNGIILIDFMGELYCSMKPTHTLKNTGMGYSAAYPTGAERCLFLVGVVSWSCSQRP